MTARKTNPDLRGHLWTDEEKQRLSALWDDGWSASRVAAELDIGVTRNAVIGQMKRLGLAPHGKPTTRLRAVYVKAGRLRPSGGGKEGASGGLARKLKAAHRRKLLGLPTLPTGITWLPKRLPPRIIATPAPPPDCNPVTLMDLGLSHCRWPLGDPLGPATLFCGAKAGDIGPYCAWHAKIAYQPPEQRRRAA